MNTIPIKQYIEELQRIETNHPNAENMLVVIDRENGKHLPNPYLPATGQYDPFKNQFIATEDSDIFANAISLN